MNIFVSLSLACGLAGLLLTAPVQAENADRGQAMRIEADSMRYDDARQVSVFSGSVQLTKGSITIRGSAMEVRQDPDGFQFGRITGSSTEPAFYRQKREGHDEYIEGQAQTIVYDGKADTVTFTDHAQLRRYRGTALADQISGALIVYANLTDQFTVDGKTDGSLGGGSGGDGRVRVTLTPKPEAAPSSAPQAGGAQ